MVARFSGAIVFFVVLLLMESECPDPFPGLRCLPPGIEVIGACICHGKAVYLVRSKATGIETWEYLWKYVFDCVPAWVAADMRNCDVIYEVDW